MAHGFNVVDFMNLQPVERRIMRMVLREISVSYPQLRDAITTSEVIDEPKLMATLDQLTENQWLRQHYNGQHIHYRVSSLQRTSSQNENFWNALELDSLNQAWSPQLQVQPKRNNPMLRSGGKRQLPDCIWDCLSEDSAPKGQ